MEVLLEYQGSRRQLRVNKNSFLINSVNGELRKFGARRTVELAGSDGSGRYLLQRWSSKWRAFVDVTELSEVVDGDRLTVVRKPGVWHWFCCCPPKAETSPELPVELVSMGVDSSTSMKSPDDHELEFEVSHVPGVNPGQHVASVGSVSPASTQEMQEMEYQLDKPLDTVSDVSEWESEVVSLASGHPEQGEDPGGRQKGEGQEEEGLRRREGTPDPEQTFIRGVSGRASWRLVPSQSKKRKAEHLDNV